MTRTLTALAAFALLASASCAQDAPDAAPDAVPESGAPAPQVEPAAGPEAGPEAGSVEAEPAGDEDCTVTSSDVVPVTEGIEVSAMAIGPTCQQVFLLLTARSVSGEPLYIYSTTTESLFGFDEATTPEAMTAALDEWIGVGNPSVIRRTSQMPYWEEGALQPGEASEFPFLPNDWVDRDYWNEIRQDDSPMYCFVQGSESTNCVRIVDGMFEEIGFEVFPG